MSLKKLDWFGIGFLSTLFSLELGEFLNGKLYSGQRLEKMTKFLQSCKKGEKLCSYDFEGLIKQGLTPKDLDNYAKVFSHVSEDKEVNYYLSHLSHLKQGNKSSARVLKDFSSRLFNLASNHISFYNDYEELSFAT